MIDKLLLSILACILSIHVHSQTYEDYFGDGNNQGVIVTSSSDELVDTVENLLNGTENFPDDAGAVRFLHQATFGANFQEIQDLKEIGIEPWIDQQMELPLSLYLDNYFDQVDFAVPIASEINTARLWFNSITFYDKALTESDYLRQKITYALLQIFVVSHRVGGFENRANYTQNYVDHLYKGSFGNFRDILHDVTFDPMMGLYLTYYQNVKGDYNTYVQPDENYAREIMQLFTIGLWELNNDGTHKKDAFGNSIPTYDNDDIQELAKVFTGLSADFPLWEHDYKVLQLTESDHDKSPKLMLDGTELPHSQTITQDVDYVLDMLFNHANTPPFIATRLIHHLVKSNPTPAYVNRVALAFINNGSGVRGDMKAVVKAVLLDPEARDCDWIDHPTSGKLISRLEKQLLLYKALDVKTPSGHIFYYDDRDGYDEQQILGAPSVFNWYSPFYAEPKFVAVEGLVSPEFQIFNSNTSIEYLNTMEDYITDKPFPNRTSSNGAQNFLVNNSSDEPYYDYLDDLEEIYDEGGAEELVNHLNLLLCRNNLVPAAKTIIIDALGLYEDADNNYTSQEAVEHALYLIISTPGFNILK